MSPDLRFHIDRRGRIIVENAGPDALAVLRVIAPEAFAPVAPIPSFPALPEDARRAREHA